MKKAVCALITRFSPDMKSFEVLGVSRKDDHDAFGLPGGKVDEGETPIEAIRRELYEETGLKALTLHPVFQRTCEGDDDYDAVTFQVYTFEGEPSTQDGEGVCKWIPAEKLLEGPFGHYNRQLFEATGHIQLVREKR